MSVILRNVLLPWETLLNANMTWILAYAADIIYMLAVSPDSDEAPNL